MRQRFLERAHMMKRRTRILAGACIAMLLAPRLMVEADNLTTDNTREQYEEYSGRFASITSRSDITEKGFEIVESQIFPFEPEVMPEEAEDSGTEPDTGAASDEETSSGIFLIPAFDRMYHRLALFLTDSDGNILYKTDQLETNSRVRGQMEQPEQEIASIAFARTLF